MKKEQGQLVDVNFSLGPERGVTKVQSYNFNPSNIGTNKDLDTGLEFLPFDLLNTEVGKEFVSKAQGRSQNKNRVVSKK